MKRHERRQQMTALVRRWRQSPDTQAVFAERHGLSRATLQYWVRRADRAPATAPVAFAPVQVLGSPGEVPGAIDIVLLSGVRVVIRPGASTPLVRTVLSTLRSAC